MLPAARTARRTCSRVGRWDVAVAREYIIEAIFPPTAAKDRPAIAEHIESGAHPGREEEQPAVGTRDRNTVIERVPGDTRLGILSSWNAGVVLARIENR